MAAKASNVPVPNQGVTMRISDPTGQSYDAQTEWSLAVLLTAMSETALHGFALKRTQVVIDHLSVIIASPAVTPELRTACDKLIGLWQNIDLQ